MLFSLSSDAGIGVDASSYLYAMLPCGTFPVSVRLSVSAYVPLHTRFVLHAKIDAINSGGCPNGDVLDIPVSVGEPLP